MAEEEDNVLYVGVEEPVEIRRTILESSKEIIESLQRFEKFKSIRNEKVENILKLKEVIKSLNKDITVLKNCLPKSKIRIKFKEDAKLAEGKIKARKAAIKKKVVKPEPVKTEEIRPQEVNELEKLESELSSIESKLSKIS